MIACIHDIAKRLKDQYGAEKVIVFGSYAKGTPTNDSDLDLLVISNTSEKFYNRQATVKRLLRDLKRGIPLAPIVLTPSELEARRRHGDQFIHEILSTGITA